MGIDRRLLGRGKGLGLRIYFLLGAIPKDFIIIILQRRLVHTQASPIQSNHSEHLPNPHQFGLNPIFDDDLSKHPTEADFDLRPTAHNRIKSFKHICIILNQFNIIRLACSRHVPGGASGA